MRNMSFSLTTQQIRQRTKFVTRRLGWKNLKPGELFRAVEKAQGLRKGEHVQSLGILRCDSNYQEQLHRMTENINYGECEVVLEGFPDTTPEKFVNMFCDHNGIQPSLSIQRIQFSYVLQADGIGTHKTFLTVGREIEWEQLNGSRKLCRIDNVPVTGGIMDGWIPIRDLVTKHFDVIAPSAITRIFISA